MTTTATATPAPTRTTAAMAAGRRDDTARRRQRVLKALNDAAAAGDEISVSGVARRAGVDRTIAAASDGHAVAMGQQLPPRARR